jgi:hypothetical protein
MLQILPECVIEIWMGFQMYPGLWISTNPQDFH